MTETGVEKRSVSWWVLLGVGIASVIGILLLAFLPSTVFERVDGESFPGYTTVCSSVVSAGWPRDLGPGQDSVVAQGIDSTDTSPPPYAECASRRTLSAAAIGVLAIPASALVYLAAARRGVRRQV